MENNLTPTGGTLRSVSIIVMSVVLAAAIAVAGYFLAAGLRDMKKTGSIVSVKGLSEKIVQSNEAKLLIRYEIAANSVTEFSAAAAAAQYEIQQFLLVQGFKQSEIQQGDVQMLDMMAQKSVTDRKSARYIGNGEIIVASDNVSLAGSTKDSVVQLLKKGVPVSVTSLKYYFTDLNAVKNDMLKDAAANARTIATTVAENAGVQIKNMQSAAQGGFEVGEPGDENRPAFSTESGNNSLNKKVRVVVNVDFAVTE